MGKIDSVIKEQADSLIGYVQKLFEKSGYKDYCDGDEAKRFLVSTSEVGDGGFYKKLYIPVYCRVDALRVVRVESEGVAFEYNYDPYIKHARCIVGINKLNKSQVKWLSDQFERVLDVVEKSENLSFFKSSDYRENNENSRDKQRELGFQKCVDTGVWKYAAIYQIEGKLEYDAQQQLQNEELGKLIQIVVKAVCAPEGQISKKQESQRKNCQDKLKEKMSELQKNG